MAAGLIVPGPPTVLLGLGPHLHAGPVAVGLLGVLCPAGETGELDAVTLSTVKDDASSTHVSGSVRETPELTQRYSLLSPSSRPPTQTLREKH